MDNFPQFDPSKNEQAGVDVPDKHKFLKDLEGLLKSRQSSELIGTFKAGAIPVLLDTLSRDTSKKGRDIVDAIYSIIQDLQEYYSVRDNPEGVPEQEVDIKTTANVQEDNKSSKS